MAWLERPHLKDACTMTRMEAIAIQVNGPSVKASRLLMIGLD